VPPGWDDWRASIDGGLPWWHLQYGSTYEYFDTTLSANGEGFVSYEGRYQTSVYGELAEQIVTQRAPSADPFFLYLSFTAPHHGEPFEADDPGLVTSDDGTVVELVSPARPDRVKGRFDHVVTEAPGARWDDPDFTDKPAYLRRLAPLNDVEKAAMLEVTRQRAESLWVVDQQVRRLVRALRRTGELDDTVVVFTSDNGYFLGEQRMRQGKTFPHDPSLRVPLLLRGPGIPAGEERTDPFTSIDVAPTLAELAGITPGHPVDGVSLVRVARKGDRGWRRGVLTETGPRFGVVRDTDERGRPIRPGRQRDIRFAIGVRTDRYLYVDVAAGGKELYDLARDPEQYRNLARAPGYADVRRRLARVLEDLRDCDGPACRAPLPDRLATNP
jgi:arylsulfatase A-like enzyme